MSVKEYALVGFLVGLGLSLALWGFTTSSKFNKNNVVVLETQVLEHNTKEKQDYVSGVKKVMMLTVDVSRVVPLVGEISENASEVAAKINELSDSSSPIILAINSPGGSVFDGALIISAMEASRAPVYTVCIQLCASMAAIIHQYGVKRLNQDRSLLMFHDVAGGAQGYMPHMISQLSTVARYITRFRAHIATRSHVSLKDLELMEHVQLWIDAEDAVNYGYSDGLVYLKLTGSNNQSMVKLLNDKQKNKNNLFQTYEIKL